MSQLLPEVHADVFISMVEDIIRKLHESPNVVPTISMVEAKSQAPNRSPSSSRKAEGDNKVNITEFRLFQVDLISVD